ncbi:hypothetical protein ACXIUS_24700 [Bosea thiooxidans]
MTSRGGAITATARSSATSNAVGRNNLTKAETVTIAAIENGVPALIEAREIIADFHAMIGARRARPLASWIERASQSLLVSLANGIR